MPNKQALAKWRSACRSLAKKKGSTKKMIIPRRGTDDHRWCLAQCGLSGGRSKKKRSRKKRSRKKRSRKKRSRKKRK